MRWINKPSLSLGSNHVDFGGMISPASETAMRSSILTGNSENATAAAPESTSRSRYWVPRAPPTKSIRVIRANVADLQNRFQQLLLQDAHVERTDRIGRIRPRRVDEASATVFEIHRDFAATGRRRRARRDIEPLAHLVHEVSGRQTRRGPSRSGDRAGSAPGRGETPRRAWSCCRRHPRATLGNRSISNFLPGARGTGGPMVPIGDIKRWDLRKRRDHRVAVGAADTPERVSHAVGGLDVEQRARQLTPAPPSCRPQPACGRP